MQVLFGRHVDVGALDSAMENVRQTEMTPEALHAQHLPYLSGTRLLFAIS